MVNGFIKYWEISSERRVLNLLLTPLSHIGIGDLLVPSGSYQRVAVQVMDLDITINRFNMWPEVKLIQGAGRSNSLL